MRDNASDFTSGSILSKLLKFMMPILGAQILQAMYGAVDLLIVGQFGSTAGISGVSTGSAIISLITVLVSGLVMGLTVQIGRYIGERRPEQAGKAIGGAVCFFSAVAAVFTVIMLCFARPFAVLMQAPAEAIDQTVIYARICGGGLIFIIAYNLISSIFRGLGNSKLPLIFVAIACGVNVFADLFFVAVLKMDVAGAAIATVLAQAVSVVLSLVIIRKQELPFRMTRRDIRFNSEIRKFVKVGVPIAFQELLTNLSFLALCAFINRLGLDASSGYGVANKLISFILLIPGSLMQSMSAFVAQNVGAGKEDRARRALFTGIAIGATIGVPIAIFAFVRGDVMSALFSSDPAVIARSAEYLKGFALEAIVTAFLFSFIGYFNGHGQTLWVMTQGLAQSFLIRLPMSYLMSIQPDASLMMIGLAAPSATIFGIVLNLIYLTWYSKKLRAAGRV